MHASEFRVAVDTSITHVVRARTRRRGWARSKSETTDDDDDDDDARVVTSHIIIVRRRLGDDTTRRDKRRVEVRITRLAPGYDTTAYPTWRVGLRRKFGIYTAGNLGRVFNLAL